MQIKTDLVVPDHVEVLEEYAFYACQNITALKFNSTSKLYRLGKYSLQLLARAKTIILPPGLTTIGEYTFSNCPLVESMTFLGEEAPTIWNNSFGSDYNSWTGNQIEKSIIYVPATSDGYETNGWEALYDTSRVFQKDGKHYYGYFNLSKTL